MPSPSPRRPLLPLLRAARHRRTARPRQAPRHQGRLGLSGAGLLADRRLAAHALLEPRARPHRALATPRGRASPAPRSRWPIRCWTSCWSAWCSRCTSGARHVNRSAVNTAIARPRPDRAVRRPVHLAAAAARLPLRPAARRRLVRRLAAPRVRPLGCEPAQETTLSSSARPRAPPAVRSPVRWPRSRRISPPPSAPWASSTTSSTAAASTAWCVFTGCTVVLALVVRQGIMLLDNITLTQELAQKENHFRSLVQGSSDVIMIAAPNGILRYVSPAAAGVYGRDAEELVGSELASIIHPEDLGRVVHEVRRFLAAPPSRGAHHPDRVPLQVRRRRLAQRRVHRQPPPGRPHPQQPGRHRTGPAAGPVAAQRRARPAHRPAQPRPVHRAGPPGARRPPRRRPRHRRALHRPRRLQGGQRHASATRPATSCSSRPPAGSRTPCGPGDTAARLGGDEFAALIVGDGSRDQHRPRAPDPRDSPTGCASPSPSRTDRRQRGPGRRLHRCRLRRARHHRRRPACATPTSRCTAPRRPARAASSCTRPRCRPTSYARPSWPPGCAPPCTTASSPCCTSPWSPSPPAGSPPSPRRPAGAPPRASCSPPPSSCASPRTATAPPSSAAGCWRRPSSRPPSGPAAGHRRRPWPSGCPPAGCWTGRCRSAPSRRS